MGYVPAPEGNRLMPISAELRRTFYNRAWKRLSLARRTEAGSCECRGECDVDHGGRCESTARLQLAHLNRTPGDDRPENLRVMCNACHLRYDRFDHRERRDARARREAFERLEAAGQQRLNLGGSK